MKKFLLFGLLLLPLFPLLLHPAQQILPTTGVIDPSTANGFRMANANFTELYNTDINWLSSATNITLDPTNTYLSAQANGITITLPEGSTVMAGRPYTIKSQSNTYMVLVTGQAIQLADGLHQQTIDGVWGGLTLHGGSAVTLAYDGTNNWETRSSAGMNSGQTNTVTSLAAGVIPRSNGSNFVASALTGNATGTTNGGTLLSTGNVTINIGGTPTQPLLSVGQGFADGNPSIQITNDVMQWALQTVGARTDRFEIFNARTGGGGSSAYFAVETNGNVSITNILNIGDTTNTAYRLFISGLPDGTANLLKLKQASVADSNPNMAIQNDAATWVLQVVGARADGFEIVKDSSIFFTIGSNGVVTLAAAGQPTYASGGFRVGATSGDPGDNNLIVDGTSQTTGNSSLIGTVAVGGAVTATNLAGSGSRAVLADANGLLSAPVSDETWKENIRPLEESYGIETVMKLAPIRFNYLDKARFGKQDYLGFGARETAKIAPEVTGQMADGTFYLTDEKLTAILVKGMQQQQVEIDRLKALVESLIKSQ